MPPLKVLAPVSVSVPAPSFVKVLPDLVRAEARVRFWLLVSILNCWMTSLEKRAE